MQPKKEVPALKDLNEPKNKHPIKVTIELDHFYDYVLDAYYHEPSFWILHVGSRTIEVFNPDYDYIATAWVTKTLHEQRYLRRRGGPQVVSLCAFKDLTLRSDSWVGFPKTNPNQTSNPYHVISICLGGTHVFFYCNDDWWEDYNFPIKPLKNLLEDKRVVVIGVGIKDVTKKLDEDWKLQIKHTVDLRKLVASAYRKEALECQNHEKGQEMMDSLELEEMAELVLDGMRLQKKSKRVLEADWHRYNEFNKRGLIKYASRNAFISYEIATKCIRKAGGLPSETESGL